MHRSVAERTEEELLVRPEIQRRHDDPKAHRIDVLRAFRDDDGRGATACGRSFAQSSCRKEAIVGDEAMVVDEQDVVSGFDITVLISVVQQDNLNVLCRLIVHESLYPVPPVGIYRDINLRELLLDLPRLVADFFHRGRC